GQIEHHINAGELFVARGTGNRIIGCVALTEQDSMWPDQATSNALYFHKLMKDPEAGDESIGMAKRLLGFTADEALRRGKDTVRCDVKTELPRLVQYYVDGFGFEPRGTAVYGSTQLEATLLETYPMTLKARCDGPDAQTEPVSIGT
ncbi:GNAT family N-acetyltransferase, partial [Candidatus Saccharibacteria bacterium]|nr:GNAT family N-acetyltransferase [Candidatus Saccharibacteria bacterium]